MRSLRSVDMASPLREHWDIQAFEEVLACNIKDVIAEFCLTDADIIRFYADNRLHGNMDDIMMSSAELFFKGETLSYGYAANAGTDRDDSVHRLRHGVRPWRRHGALPADIRQPRHRGDDQQDHPRRRSRWVRVRSIGLRTHSLLRPLEAAAAAVHVFLLPGRDRSALSAGRLKPRSCSENNQSSRFCSDCQARSRPAIRRTCFTARVRGGRRMFADTIRNTRLPGAGRVVVTTQDVVDGPVAVYPDVPVIDAPAARTRRYEVFAEVDMPPAPGFGDLRLRPILSSTRLRSLRLRRRPRIAKPPLRSRQVRPASLRAPSAPPPMQDPGKPPSAHRAARSSSRAFPRWTSTRLRRKGALRTPCEP